MFLSSTVRETVKIKSATKHLLNASEICSIVITSALNPERLVESWALDPAKGEFTWMEVHITSGSEQRKWIIEDGGMNGDSSMARTTGLVTSCCAIAWAEHPDLLSPGVHAPEDLPNSVIESIIEIMRSEGVSIELR